MKRVNNLYYKICDLDNIIDMYNKVKTNTKNKLKIERFNNFYSLNLVNIKELLCSKKYNPGRYNIFLIKEPKYRIIMSQSIKDKIVNHLVSKYFLIDVFDKSLIDENCATRIVKGTHYALKLFKKYYNECILKYKKFYILKFDISKYFYNIDHDIVMNLIKNKIKDKEVLKIIKNIIISTDEKYVNETIKKLKNKEKSKILNSNIINKEKIISEIDLLPLYIRGKGCPIGNMSSQIIATFYLNELDHFIKENLNIKYYVRYMDDGIIVHKNYLYLKKCIKDIETILNKYKLSLNKKSKIYKSSEEIEFLGFRFSYNNKIIMKVSNKTKKRFKKKIKSIDKVNMSLKVESVIVSYKGHLSYGTCGSLFYKILKNKSVLREK